MTIDLAELVETVANGQRDPDSLDPAPGLAGALFERTMRALREDLDAAGRLAHGAKRVAGRGRDKRERGLADRLLGHVALLRGRHRLAWGHYVRSRRNLLAAGEPKEAAITATGAIQALIYADRFDEAFALAEEARSVLAGAGDSFRIARLDVNLANALHRLDRHGEALERYLGALPVLEGAGAFQDVALSTRNAAVCLMALGRFLEADAYYERSAAYFREHGMVLPLRETDFNRAYSLGRQGRYREALASYRRALGEWELTLDSEPDFEIGNALLDQSEFLIQIGLRDEGYGVAERAERAFRALGLRSELGRALLVKGLAALLAGRLDDAVRDLNGARRALARGRNPVWRGLAELYLGLADDRAGAGKASRLRLRRALDRLRTAGARERHAEAALLVAEADLRVGDGDAAKGAAREASAAFPGPLVDFHTAWIVGRAERLDGEEEAARSALGRARSSFEGLRGDLGSAGLRLSFQTDRTRVFEDAFLVEPDSEGRFAVVQQAKARTLAETLGQGLVPGLGGPHESLPTPAPLSLADVQGGLGPGTAVLEAFVADGRLWGLDVRAERCDLVDWGPAGGVEDLGRRLRFHLARAQRGGRGGAEALALLDELGALTLGRVGSLPDSVVLAPAGPLLGLPWHAALVEGAPLALARSVVSVPSATVWHRLGTFAPWAGGGGAVLAAPDEAAPQIADEAREVGEALGAEALVVGHEATPAALRDLASRHRWLHVAAHGLHREDNPALSSIRLAGGDVCALDLAAVPIRCERVVLSGCSTGLDQIGRGDEPTGLIQACLAAGARQVVGSFWDADDALSRVFMRTLAGALGRGEGLGRAYPEAVQAVKSLSDHPAHWATFAVFGRF